MATYTHDIRCWLALSSSVLLIFGLGACATTSDAKRQAGGRPDWVDGRSAQYAEPRYFTGVGHARARQTAEAHAYAAIAKIFEVAVQQHSKDFEAYTQRVAADGASQENRLTLEQLTKVSTDKVVENVRIAEVWDDPADGLTYVLAVLDRRQAGTALRQRLTALDVEIAESLRTAQEANSRLQVVRGLHRAYRNLLVREVFNADLRVIHASGVGIPSDQSIEEVRSALDDYLARYFTVAVEVEGDAPREVRAYLTEGLTQAGFYVLNGDASGTQTVHRRDPAAIIARVRVHLLKTDLGDPQWHYIRWQARFSLYDTHAQQTFGSLNRAGREGHLTLAEARLRALRALQQEVLTDLSQRLVAFVYGASE